MSTVLPFNEKPSFRQTEDASGVPASAAEDQFLMQNPEPSGAHAPEGVTAAATMPDARFGLLGHPLGHSWSPEIHHLLGSWPYGLIDLEEAEAERFLAEGSWQGLNVTIPYKRLAARITDTASPEVLATGAANTLVHAADGTIRAHNTDVAGFLWLLERLSQTHFDMSAHELLNGQKVLVLGSGGASAAVAYALGELEARPVIVSRQGPETYETLAERHNDAKLLVNATPVGMYPNCPKSPLALDTLKQLDGLVAAVDLIYNPRETQLLAMAKKLGLKTADGLSMLVAQAWAASALFQDKELSLDLLERTLATIAKSHATIFFIGMPGSGKTGAARRLAHMCGRPFVDLDDAFLVAYGEEPASYITGRGESAFRDAETAVLAQVAKEGGLVVATGGGVVTRPENLDLMRQNGFIVFLDRPLDELTSANRPLSQKHGVEELARVRLPLYRSWADVELACTGSAEGDALAIKERYNL